jgi:pimeloyl-ACP methyl ester carboxylesterase
MDCMAVAPSFFVPANPGRVLVLAHGFPWVDGSRTDDELALYAAEAVERWASFAEAQRAIVIAPAFGGTDFGGYRALFGRVTDADVFVNALVDEAGSKHIAGFGGRFSLHGHSAGAQFAARYLVTHPGRLETAVLSAPGAYPWPEPALPWPDGMAPVERDELSGAAAGTTYTPRLQGWLDAAGNVPVTVLVGSRDTEVQQPEPGQQGATRIDRATAWVASMRRLAAENGRAPTIELVQADRLDHDEAAMAIPAQALLAERYGSPAGPPALTSHRRR